MFRIVVCLMLIPFLSEAQHVNVNLIARNTGEKVLASNDTIRVFGFATSLGSQPDIPGPTIIANEGDSVHIDLWNVSQGAPHTIHLHGLDVNQQNDGVPHLSFDIPHMSHGYYNFKALHAGTYLYHCHVASTIHVQAGMYGLIIIKPADGSNTTWSGGHPYTNAHSFFLSEIDTVWHNDSILLHDHDTSMAIHAVSIPDYHPQYFLINGFSDQQLVDQGVTVDMASNQIDYVRLANIGYYGVRIIFPSQMNTRIVSSDGRPFNVEEISDTIVIFPGERYGALIESSSELNSQIEFEYFNLNTNEVLGVQQVNLAVSGFLKINELETLNTELSISPNPILNEFNINFTLQSDDKVSFEVFDIKGKQIWKKTALPFSKGRQSFCIKRLNINSGIYFVQISNDNNVLGIQRFVKI